jgi:uncharacterized protein (TIGR04255 family)
MRTLEAVATRMNTEACPSFRNPPVVETALSIQFDELRNFRTTHFGMYHTTIVDRFPIADDKPRIESVTELFPPLPRVPAFRIGPADGRPGRVWFRDATDGSMMLQLQPDRFALNWCQREGQEYPRYASNQPKLIEEFDGFRNFASENELGDIKPNLCEVTYVNHIKLAENETPTECFATVFTGVNWKSSDGWLPQPPDVVSFNRVFTIGEQKGRLYAEAAIASDSAKSQFILLKITARVIYNDGDDLCENLELAHLWVVKSFVSLTENQVRQERWEQDT